MDWLSTKLDNLINWIGNALGAVFGSLISFLKDFVVWVVDLVLSGIVSLLEAVPVPSFLSQGLQPLFSALPPPLLYLMDATGLIAGLAIIGAGVVFLLTRKLLTLGQW